MEIFHWMFNYQFECAHPIFSEVLGEEPSLYSGKKDISLNRSNPSFENVAKFKYLGTTLTNRNEIHDEIKSRLNSGNACYYSAQNLLSSRLI
jgi:hypothetical protein